MARRRIRRKKLAAPIKLGDVIDKRARRWRFQMLGKLEVIRAHWGEAAGEFVAAHVIPVRLVRKQLRLAVDDASWISEMTYLAPSILQRLQELLPGKWVDELKAVASEPLPQDTLPRERSVSLAPVDQQMLSTAEGLVREIDDKELSEAIRRARLAQLRRST